MLYHLTIPVNRYQLAILTAVLGSNPWRLTTKVWLGKVLTGYMGRSRRIPHAAVPSNEAFIVEIPYSFVHQKGLNHISSENVTEFISSAEREFRRGLFIYVEHALLVRDKLGQGCIRKLNLTIKDSMREYCNKFGLNDADIPFDALTKAFYRSRVSAGNSVVLSSEYYSRKLSDAR